MCICSVIQGLTCQVQVLTPKAIPSYKYHKNRISPYAHITIISIEYTNKHLQKIHIAEFIMSFQNEGDLNQNTKRYAAVRTCFKQRFRG